MRSVSAVAALALLVGGAAVSTPHAHVGRHLARIVSQDTARKTIGAKVDTYLKGLAARNQLSGTVLVARKGTVLLSRGYGMAVRERRVPNRSTTRYPLPGISFSLSLAAGLRLEDQGKLKDSASVCSYLATCPASWKPITVHMVLDGTSGLSDSGWGEAGHTTMQSLAHCQGESLTAAPGSRLNYQNCTVVVLGTIFQRVSGKPWQTFMRQEIFGPAGMKNSGRMTDALVPPARAQDYSGTAPDTDVVYNDYFQVYGTVPDVYAYDNALFGGRLLSRTSLRRLVAARGSVSPPDAYITEEHQAAKWKVGSFLRHQVIFTTDDTKSFLGVNLRFPKDGVTVVVISNDDQNDVEDVAVHAAAMVFGAKIPAPGIPTVDPAKAIMASITEKTAGQTQFAFTDGALWTVNNYDGTITRIDTATNRIAAVIKAGDPARDPNQGDPFTVAAGGRQLWATDRADQAVVRIDPATNDVVQTIPIGIRAFGLAVVGSTLWAAGGRDNPSDQQETVVRVDLQTGKVAAVLHVGGVLWLHLAATEDAVWLTSWNPTKVLRLDPATNKVVAAVDTGSTPESLDLGEGAVWVADRSGAQLTRIDPQSNKVSASITFGQFPGRKEETSCTNVAVGGGAVWTLANNSTLLRIEPQSNTATAALTFHRPVYCVAWGAGSVWIGSDTNQGTPDQIDRIDPAAMGPAPTASTVDPSKAVLASINFGHPLGTAIVADGAVWTGYADASTVSVMRVDPGTKAVAATIKVGDAPQCQCGPGTLATAQGQIWFAEYAAKRLMRIDPATNAITTSIPIRIRPTDLAIAAGSLWAISYDDNGLVRVDPATGKVIATINNLPAPAQIAAADDAVWVSTYGDSSVHRIDPATNGITASIHVDNFPESLAVDNGTLWVSTNRPQNLVRIDTLTNKIVAALPLSSGTNSDMQGPCCRAVAVGEGAVWAIAHNSRSLDRIDPQMNRITATVTLPVPPGVGKIEPWDVATGEGSIWVNADPGILYRIDPKAMATQ